MLDNATIIAAVIVAAMVITLIGYAIRCHYHQQKDQRFDDFVKGFEHGYHDVVSDAQSACLHPMEHYMNPAYDLPYGAYKQGVIRGIHFALNSL